MTKKVDKNNRLLQLPVAGSLLFFLLYYIATRYYPGGSHYNTREAGFSWIHNYWCNLLDERSINGMPNTARPIALAAMLVLCVSLAIFWWQFPNHTRLRKPYRLSIQIFGSLAMINALLLLTPLNHDLVINISSGFGLLATLGTMIGLYRNGWRLLFYFGLFNLGMVIANNILYYNSGLAEYLPVVQKISFFSFLLWICLICTKQLRSE